MLFSINEAAQGLGLGPSQVRRRLAKGEIKGKKLGHDWIVRELKYKKNEDFKPRYSHIFPQ
jgi:DNA-binding Lrp family transcriptional regulator